MPPPGMREKALDGAKRAIENYERKQVNLHMEAVVNMIVAKIDERLGQRDQPKVDKSEGAKPSIH